MDKKVFEEIVARGVMELMDIVQANLAAVIEKARKTESVDNNASAIASNITANLGFKLIEGTVNFVKNKHEEASPEFNNCVIEGINSVFKDCDITATVVRMK